MECLVPLAISVFVGMFLWQRSQQQVSAAPAIEQQAGRRIAARPIYVVRYSTWPGPPCERGALSIGDGYLVFHTATGNTERYPLRAIQWIAAGTMWQQTATSRHHVPFLLVAFQDGAQVAFQTCHYGRLCQHLYHHHHLRCGDIPHGYGIYEDRLVRR